MRIPERPPSSDKLWAEVRKDLDTLAGIFQRSIDPAPNGRYRHWDKIRHLSPPGGLTHLQWWFALKNARRAISKEIPLLDTEGRPFTVCLPDPAQEMLPEIDSALRGRIEFSEEVTNSETSDRYIVSSLIDEAITSSQLEGAHTTYKVAKQMLRSGRDPKNKSEQMIVNNYLAMSEVRRLRETRLTPSIVMRLHQIVTEGTLDANEVAGRFRTDEDHIVVEDRSDGTVLHVPPAANELPNRMRAMCKFANGAAPQHYIHPVVRAILLHFWLAYDHPFTDGNGRTARVLFYWAMLRQDYWLSEFISISKVLRQSAKSYVRSYLYTETDENDTTYFVLYNLRKTLQAIENLNKFLRRKMKEVRQVEDLIRRSGNLNSRQIALLSHAIRHPDAAYSVKSHQTSHHVVYETARSDLRGLVARGLLQSRRIGRQFRYWPAENLVDRLSKYRGRLR